MWYLLKVSFVITQKFLGNYFKAETKRGRYENHWWSQNHWIWETFSCWRVEQRVGANWWRNFSTFQLEKVNCLYSTSVWNLKHSLNFSLIHKGNLGSSWSLLGIHLRPSSSLLSDEGETQEMFALCKKWKENNVTALSAFEAVLTLTTLTFLSFMTPGENTLNNMLCFLAALLT